MNYPRDEIIKQLGIVAENEDKKRGKLQKDYILKCYLEGTKAEFNESEFNRLQRYHNLIVNGNPDLQKTFTDRANASNIENILSEIEQEIAKAQESNKSKTNSKKSPTKGTTLYSQLKKIYGTAFSFKLFGLALEWTGLEDQENYSPEEIQKLEQTCLMYFSENQTPEAIRAFHGVKDEGEARQEEIVESLAVPTAESLARTMVKQNIQTERGLARAIELRAMAHLQQMVSSGQFEKMAQEERNRLLETEIHPIRVIEATSQKALAPESEKETKQ